MNSVWSVILGAAVVSYFLRVTPFLLSRVVKPLSRRWVEGLENVSFAIIGGLVAESLLGGESLSIRGAACLLAFVTAFFWSKPNLVFYLIFFAFYFVSSGFQK